MMEPATKAFTRKIKSVCQQVSLPTTLFSPGDGTLSILHRSTPAASTCPLRATEALFLHPRRRLHLQHPLLLLRPPRLLLRPPRLQLLRQLLVRASLTTNSVVALVGRDLPLAVMAAPAKLSMITTSNACKFQVSSSTLYLIHKSISMSLMLCTIKTGTRSLSRIIRHYHICVRRLGDTGTGTDNMMVPVPVL